MRYFTEHIKSIIAVAVIVGAFTYFFITYFVGKAQSDPQIIIAIVGAMTTVLAYYFGSASSSVKKDETIAELTRQSQPVVTQTGNDPSVNVTTPPSNN